MRRGLRIGAEAAVLTLAGAMIVAGARLTAEALCAAPPPVPPSALDAAPPLRADLTPIVLSDWSDPL